MGFNGLSGCDDYIIRRNHTKLYPMDCNGQKLMAYSGLQVKGWKCDTIHRLSLSWYYSRSCFGDINSTVDFLWCNSNLYIDYRGVVVDYL